MTILQINERSLNLITVIVFKKEYIAKDYSFVGGIKE